MKKVTQQICNSFENGNAKKIGNTYTDGKRMFLFDNLIAEHREDGLYICNCGWFSRTTKERLNGLSMVKIVQAKGKWYLNGKEWDGEWIRVCEKNPPIINEKAYLKMWNFQKKWVSTDGWRGYEQPMYAICGANDTGMSYDSPCKTNVCLLELNMAMSALKKNNIPYKLKTCETSNIFCVHHYIIVKPIDKDRAYNLIEDLLQNVKTELLYSVNN